MVDKSKKRGEPEKAGKASEPVKRAKPKASSAATPGKAARAKPGVAKKPAASKAPSRAVGKSTSFALHAPQATQVCVAGSFNEWDMTAMRLERDEAGAWRGVALLQPGRYEYRLVVDGEWWDDPLNPMRCGNEFGTQNCILIVEG